MKIHYDNIIYSLQNAGGISSYWTSLISRFLRDNFDISFTEYTNQNISRLELNIPSEKLIVQRKKLVLVERFKKLFLKNHHEPFIFHSSYNRFINHPQAKSVVTIHDFVHERFYGGLRRYLHVLQKNKAIEAADQIIVVSENTRRDLLKFHPSLKEERITVIYNGVSDAFFPVAAQSFTQRPYLLFIGSRAYYKNFNFAVQLLQTLPEFDLYIVGAALSKSEGQSLNHKLSGRWKVFTHIENQELNLLYNQAFALVYPSSYEGFGIPLLEVMKTGTPFVALNRSSIPEVAGDAGLLVNELDIDAFRQAIYSISGNEALLRVKGLEQSKKFSWEQCYQETLQVYQALVP